MMSSDDERLARALADFCSGSDSPGDYLSELLTESCQTQGCIWSDICRKVIGGTTCDKTVTKNVRRWFQRFKRNYHHIRQLVLDHLSRNRVESTSISEVLPAANDCLEMVILSGSLDEPAEQPDKTSDGTRIQDSDDSEAKPVPSGSHSKSVEVSDISCRETRIQDETDIEEPKETRSTSGHDLQAEDDETDAPEEVMCAGSNIIPVKTLTLPPEFFEKFWIQNEPTLLKGWSNAMSRHFKEVNDECVLSFEWHKVQYGKRKTKYSPFIAKAHCKMEGCCQYRFEICEPICRNCHFKVHISQIGEYDHSSGQICSRFITGDDRDELGVKVRQSHACVLAAQMIAAVDERVLKAGNRNDAPSTMLLNKIASDQRKKFDLDPEFHSFLTKLKHEFDSDEEWGGTVLNGFIQGYSVYPTFSVTMFSEKQLRLIIELIKTGDLCLHFDATGTLFAQPPDSDKRAFYYCLVVAGGTSVPVAVLEFINCGHDVYSIHKPLDLFVMLLKKLTDIRPVIPRIETDFSKAMIQAACKACNNMDVVLYLEKMWDRIHFPAKLHSPLTVIHVCSSHLIKSSINRIKKFTDEKTVRILLKSAMGLLIHTTDLKDALGIFEKICKLFGCSKKCENHDLYLDELIDIKQLDLLSGIDSTRDTAISEELDDPLVFPTTQREQSKFYSHFAAEYDRAMSGSANCNSDNPLYVPQFVRYLVDELLPYYPLWSGVAIKQFGIRRSSNAAVENWNKIIKTYVFDGEMRQLIPRAIRTLAENVKNRLVQRTYGCKTTRQTQNEVKRNQDQQEVKNGKNQKKVKSHANRSKSQRNTRQKTEISNEQHNVAKNEDVSPKTLTTTTNPVKRKFVAENKEHTLNEVRCSVNNSAALFPGTKRVKAVEASQKMKEVINAEEGDADVEVDIDFDLTKEGWFRRSQSLPCNAGFQNFPKTMEQWQAEQKFEAEKKFEAENGFEAEKEFEAEQRFEAEKEFEAEQRFEAEKEFEAEKRFEAEKEFEAEQRFEAEKEFEAEKRFEAEKEFEAEKRFEAEKEFDVEKRFEAGKEFEAEKRFEAEKEFEAEKRFEAEKEFDVEKEFEAEKEFDVDKRFEAEKEFEAEEKFEAETGFDAKHKSGTKNKLAVTSTLYQSSMNLPWQGADIRTYPENWKQSAFYLASFMINEHCLKTLLPGQQLDDNIVNCFLQLAMHNNSNGEVLIVDSQFFVTLMDDSKRFGFVRWAQKVQAWNYNIWLMPKCEGNHWTLMLIIFPTRWTLPLTDVLAVDYVGVGDHEVGGEKLLAPTSFLLHYAARGPKNKWSHHNVRMSHTDPRQVASWVKTIRNYLTGLTHRPKKILVFVNPVGGKKRGLKIWKRQVEPLLAVAGVETRLLITERAGHIRDTLLTCNLDEFQAVACVGGDGTFSEVFNGLVLRTVKDKEIDANDPDIVLPPPKLPVGVIPSGSTDTVAYSLHGTTDVQTAAIHIIFGDSTGLDLSSIHSDRSLLRLYASVLSYGYLGDVMKDSEKFRWMGPQRYDYSGFKKILANKGYEGEIHLLSDPCHPAGSTKCTENCTRCIEHTLHNDSDKEISRWLTVRGKFWMVNGANVSCACDRSPLGFSPHCHVGDGCVDLILIRHTSFFNNIRVLLRLSSKHKNLYDLPFVEVYRAREFTFQALPEPQHPTDNTEASRRNVSDLSVWNCDGEVIQDSNLKIRVHCQLLKVFTRRSQDSIDDASCFC